MKKIYLLLVLFSSIIANDAVHEYAPSEECKGCHTTIYNEFYTSMHANSTPQADPIHNAIWKKHPQNLKQNRYECGKCHTPAANNVDKMVKKGQKAPFDAKNQTHQEAISCAYCHRIKSVEKHKMHNTNIMHTDQKAYVSASKKSVKSDYHEVVADVNGAFKKGDSCIGCHSHKKNKADLFLCSTDIDNKEDGANCVSCHMPKVNGNATNDIKSASHAFHGFAGAHNNSEMLRQYVDISVLGEKDNFIVKIHNKASHALLLHPLRVAALVVKIKRGNKVKELKKEMFMRVIGKDGKPAMPWIADKTLKNTMIQANETRTIKYDFKLQKGDTVGVALGWYLVNPKAVKKLGLEKEDVATKFNLFKLESFTF